MIASQRTIRTFAATTGTLLLAMLLATPAAAQPTSRPAPGQGQGGPGAGMILQRVQEVVGQLGLSDEQKTKVQTIVKKAQDDWQEMRSDLESMDPQERGQRIRSLIDDTRKQIGEVLTTEQKAVLDKKFEEGRQAFRNRFGQGQGQGAATTRPGQGGPGGRPGEFADRLRENLQKLNLSDDQKAKVKDLFDEVKTKADGLRMQAESGVEEARTQMRQMFQDTREKLNAILTAEQRDKLRELMGGPGGANPRDRRPNQPGEPGRPRPGQNATSQKADAAGDKSMMQDGDNMMSMSGAGSSKSSNTTKKDTVALAPATPGLAVGESIPQLAFKKLDGSALQLSSLKGHVVVLEFGSYTCPAFRNRAAAMEKLKAEYGTRASFFIVYGKEAHALGEWEVDRNKDEGISVEQPKSIDARKTLADEARDKLKITVPIVMDTIGNDAAGVLGAGANSAYVISRDGTILAKQKWFEPIALRRILDEATKTETAKTNATTKPAA